MSTNDDFLDGLKSDQDRTKEWTDAAQFFYDIRRGAPEEIEPLPEKTAGLKDMGKAVAGVAGKIDPTGLVNAMGKGPQHRIAALGGAALFGAGTALASRGKKEYGGESGLEHALKADQKQRHSQPEPKGFVGKMRNNFSDFTTGLATTARKHPVAAGAMGALGGAKAGTYFLSKLTGKAT
jgi:hypothetical protein